MMLIRKVISLLVSILIRRAKHTQMKKENFSHLLGKTRNEIKKEMGDGFNYFNNRTWTYEVGTAWLRRKIVLSLIFEDENVAEIKLDKIFGRC